jgi:hypothetical protein
MGATISASTRLNKALDLHPDVLEYIVSLNPHDFVRLRNPLMRRVMSPRITLGRIAAMTHVPLTELLTRVASLGGTTVVEGAAEQVLPQSPAEPPLWLAEARPDEIREVNLLPMDATLDSDPLPPVMHAVNALALGEILCIRHKWEPQPFYDMWSKIGGLEWFAAEISSDEWHIWVRRIASPKNDSTPC